MRTKITTLALLLSAALAAGQTEWLIKWEPNPALPRDVVEIARDYATPVDGFYMQKPSQRPVDVPPTYVLVQAMRVDRESHTVRLLGWCFLDADLVNFLHGIGPPMPVAMQLL